MDTKSFSFQLRKDARIDKCTVVIGTLLNSADVVGGTAEERDDRALAPQEVESLCYLPFKGLDLR